MNKYLQRFLKAFHGLRHPEFGALFSFLPNTSFDYAARVGDGLQTNVIMSPVGYIARQLPESELSIRDAKGGFNSASELLDLVRTPNEFYGGADLIHATSFSLDLDGNAYWARLRNEAGRVVQLWYLPHWLVTPERNMNDPEVFISHYNYNVGAGGPQRFELDEIIHFRNGIDPRDTRLGFAQLKAIMREAYTDDEAANFTASVLRNQGIGGLMISPKDGAVSESDAKATKDWFRDNMTGDKRGQALVMRGATEVKQMTVSLKDIDLGALRNIPEERVCAALGLPAAVVGFGTGVQQTKVGATIKELRREAWSGAVIPRQRVIARALTRTLGVDFGLAKGERVAWDNSEVSVLQEDKDAVSKRAKEQYISGIITRSTALEMIGQESGPADDVRATPINLIIEPADATPEDRAAADAAATEDAETRMRNGIAMLEKRGNPGDDMAANILRRVLEKRTDVTAVGSDSPLSTEADVLANAEKVKPNAAERRIIRMLDRLTMRLADVFTGEMVDFLAELGADAARAALEVLPEDTDAVTAAARRASFKGPRDEVDAEAILKSMSIDAATKKMGKKYKTQFLRVAQETFKGVEAIAGLGVSLPDEVARRIVADGGTRAGLVDLSKSLKRRIARELAKGRTLGEGRDALVRRMRDFVPAGRFNSPVTRARLIARTETTFARNMSMAEFGRQAQVDMIVFDGRLGATDALCEAMNGVVVSADEAERLSVEEHPNGTRSFSIRLQPPKRS